jgi:ABC-type multidrug transport system ATPase subunit
MDARSLAVLLLLLRHVLLQGLDPASRRNLWDVVKSNKRDRAIVLTTHSMEEAEMLCDRLGIFVDGRLVCIGNPKEITSRYGGFLVRGASITTLELGSTVAVVSSTHILLFSRYGVFLVRGGGEVVDVLC